MVYIKNAQQIDKMRIAGEKLYEVLQKVKEAVKPGITTAALDVYAEQLIKKQGATPSFLRYGGGLRTEPYPASLCTSVDEQIVHGIPSQKTILTDGQIVSLDCGLIWDGWHADSALTVGVGQISQEAQRLIQVTEECFWKGARQAVAGRHLGDIGYAVQTHAESNGYGVIRHLSGHGIGRSMHEDPEVANFGEPGRKSRLREGMTFAIEPMICAGDWDAAELDDGWTFVTKDRSLCSHYEHTVAVTDDGLPLILTLPGFKWDKEGL